MIKQITFLLFSVTSLYNLYSQNTSLGIEKKAEQFYLMHHDTSAIKKYPSKSAIIEFKDFIVLLEMPLAYSNSNISDHKEGGELILKRLKTYFPKKPLRYIVSSHWHPHSISSITPFLNNGIKIISTKANFEILKPIIDSTVLQKNINNIILLEQDSMVISDKTNSLILYKILKKDYSYLPTEEFIYVYNPKHKILQTSCMYQRLGNFKIRGKEMISGRTENLYSFIQLKHLSVNKMLCTENFFDDENNMISIDSLELLMQNGIGMIYLENQLCALSVETLVQKRDSLIKAFVISPISFSVLNKSVYSLLRQKQYTKALALAQIQALLNPSDPNTWDTLGEVYYFMGENAVALRYEKQCLKMDANYSGGMKEWKINYDTINK